MLEVFAFAVQLLLGIVVTSWVLRRDESRLDAARLARAWSPASFWCAVVAFGPLCIPVHFVRTRRSLWGGVQGVLWLCGVLLALSLVDTAIGALGGTLGTGAG